MDEMIKQSAVEGFESGMENRVSEKNIGNTAEMIAVDEENRDLDSAVDRLKHSLRVSKTLCIILGVVTAVVLIARLLV